MKYTFDPSSKKFVCPNCNKKRFVRLIDTESNKYLDENYGRCDRETSCGYYKKPENDFAKNTFIVNNKDIAIKIAAKQDFTPTYHTNQLLQKSLQQYCKNNFYSFLISIFEIDKVQKILDQYKVGTSKTWQGATVFWQIDANRNIRAGKIILFDQTTCKRVKEPFPHISWAHSKLKINPFHLIQCLFGLHLVNNSNKIAITESEKTAVIMSLFLPEYTWLSTGSKQNFNYEILAAIKGKEIIAFPDKSEFNFWNLRAHELNKQGFKIKVSDYLEKINCEAGTDLADIYISIQNNKPIQEELTLDEKEIIRLAKVNIYLLNLIESFGLSDSYANPINLEKIKLNL